MPIAKHSVQLTRPDPANDPDRVRVAIINETFDFSVEEIRQCWRGQRDPRFLLFQMFIVLHQAGVDPRTATAAQIRNAIEAQTYLWGN